MPSGVRARTSSSVTYVTPAINLANEVANINDNGRNAPTAAESEDNLVLRFLENAGFLQRGGVSMNLRNMRGYNRGLMVR